MRPSREEILIGSQVKRDPKVSVIIPHYNSAAFIAETLDSVFAQTFKDFEVIVVNDGSPDAEQLRSALRPYIHRIVFIDERDNGGASVARNIGVEHSRGEFLSFLDADDIWLPTFLEELLAFRESSDFDMAYADAEKFYVHLNKRVGDFLAYNPPQGNVTREMLIAGKCHIFVASGALLRRSAFLSVGGFDPKVFRTEDFDLAVRLAFSGARMGYLRKILFIYRMRPGSNSGDSVVRYERNVKQWRILQEKLEFTDEENSIVEGHIGREEAAVLRAKGHAALERGEWTTARQNFLDAKVKADELGLPLRHKFKLGAVSLMLRIWPNALRYLYLKFRAGEAGFLPQGDG